MAHYITFANTKGGAAKTTSALMFGLVLAARGEKVEIRDTDPSGGATDWKKMAQKNGTPLPFLVHSANMKEVDEPPVDDADWVLIDTPPLQAEIIQAAIAAADLVVLTTQPSKLDVTRAIETAEAVDKPMTVLVTRVDDRTTEWRECEQRLKEAGLSRLDSYIKARESIKHAVGTNNVPSGSGYKEAVDEVMAAFR
ncbi:ParA family protein [Bifidobacterium mongoliense]|jgi:chromosome partitioning protein|uniref:Chromosome partitioning protein ParA n=1 Tax=Bifidobacterium mongoliense TaxID=518643 RepID=A0A423UC68_9BIFI|nr:ParA family protein [Bifidobacterium mongoliense]ROT86278.1 chromosome partitioning protein ParA [Bifidobacterium mongoliense]